MHRQTFHVPDGSSHSHRKTGLVRSPSPIQWHLKRHWHALEILEKIIPIQLSLHPHLDWWLDERNVLRDQPLHGLQVFTDASNEGWGAHLEDSNARGVWLDT